MKKTRRFKLHIKERDDKETRRRRNNRRARRRIKEAGSC